MSVHWHDDELAWCPCDGPESAYPAPEVKAEVLPVIDWDQKAGQWIGRCPEHGEVLRAADTSADHNLIVIMLAKHDEELHGGDGKVHWSRWLR